MPYIYLDPISLVLRMVCVCVVLYRKIMQTLEEIVGLLDEFPSGILPRPINIKLPTYRSNYWELSNCIKTKYTSI